MNGWYYSMNIKRGLCLLVLKQNRGIEGRCKLSHTLTHLGVGRETNKVKSKLGRNDRQGCLISTINYTIINCTSFLTSLNPHHSITFYSFLSGGRFIDPIVT